VLGTVSDTFKLSENFSNFKYKYSSLNIN
jgi:hypothetical protein